uniref:Secreted protein n=1 Tax=Mesocestoides corti TaxID=53468 RepID=A0A5K3FT02_MESCO
GENRGFTYIIVLVFLFSPWSITRHCNGDGKLESILARIHLRVIQCPREATQPDVAPPLHMTSPPRRAD